MYCVSVCAISSWCMTDWISRLALSLPCRAWAGPTLDYARWYSCPRVPHWPRRRGWETASCGARQLRGTFGSQSHQRQHIFIQNMTKPREKRETETAVWKINDDHHWLKISSLPRDALRPLEMAQDAAMELWQLWQLWQLLGRGAVT